MVYVCASHHIRSDPGVCLSRKNRNNTTFVVTNFSAENYAANQIFVDVKTAYLPHEHSIFVHQAR